MTKKRYKVSLSKEEAERLIGRVNDNGLYRFDDKSKSDAIRVERDKMRNKTVFEEYCESSGIDQDSISAYWDKSDKFSILVRPQSVSDDINYDYIKEAVKDINFKVKPPTTTIQSDEVLRIIITDIHVGMETDSKGYGLYPKVWNRDELFKCSERILKEVSKYKQQFKEVHVIDLGDMMDGWNGTTTRGGHNLPQNMSNRDAFKVGVKFKVELYNQLQHLTGCKVKAYNVCNDNHSSDFGYVVNETVKNICELQNPNIEVTNFESFISHYVIGNHCFLLCHGKDELHMKFGFKVKLDAVIESKIRQYICYHKLNDYFITFEKGDSHQQLLDSTSSEYFDYHNYRALSPASSWVQHNFKLGTCGFTLMTIELQEKAKNIKQIEI
mgnify:FL=1